MPASIVFDARQSDVVTYGDKSGPLDTDGFSQAVAFQDSESGVREVAIAGTVRAGSSGNDKVGTNLAMRVGAEMRVRRLTPLECERLQGFPDGFTDIEFRGKPAKDAPRYKALGNSMNVDKMRWIGERIRFVDAIGEVAG